ncbi:MerR family transcriptional regulator [bacterium]|nr:MerR family transcriptional regulator [bacterium]
MYYNTKTVSQIIGVTARQLGYWDKTGLVKPSIAQAEGKGTRRLYSFLDIIQIRTAKALRNQGMSLQNIRKCVAFLRKHAPEIEHPLAELKLLTDGQTIFVLTADKDVIMDTLNSGQLVLSLAIGQFVNNIREKIVQLTQRFVETVVVDDFEYQVIIESDPQAGGYVIECPAIKGCVSQGETKEEAIDMIKDAIVACLEVLSERGKRKAYAEVA